MVEEYEKKLRKVMNLLLEAKGVLDEICMQDFPEELTGPTLKAPNFVTQITGCDTVGVHTYRVLLMEMIDPLYREIICIKPRKEASGG